MDFYRMPDEVAAAAAALYAVNSPRYQCACGFSTASGREHASHRGGLGDWSCQATWSKR